MASAGDETEGKKKGADDDIYDELPTDFKIDDAANSGREIVEFEFIPASGERGKFVKKEKSVSQGLFFPSLPALFPTAAQTTTKRKDQLGSCQLPRWRISSEIARLRCA